MVVKTLYCLLVMIYCVFFEVYHLFDFQLL